MNLRLIPFLLLLPIIACKKRLVAEILESIKYTTFEISDASEIASIFEITDAIVDDLRDSYGIEYSLITDTYLLNKEIFAMLTSPDKEQKAILRGEQDYHKDGPFIFFMDLRKKLLQIKEKAMETMTAKEQKIMNRNDYGDMFLTWIFHIKPITKLAKQNKKLFSELNLATEENIKAQIFATQEKIADRWVSGQDPVGPEELLRRLKENGLDRAAFERGEIDILGNPIREEL